MTDQPDKQSNSDWTVTVEREALSKKLRRITSLTTETNTQRTSYLILLAPLALFILGLGSCAFNTVQQANRKTAARSNQAYAAVTGFLNRMESRKQQLPSLMRRLDAQIAELQPVLRASSPDKSFAGRVETAISSVAKLEKEALDAETGEGQAAQALASLVKRADYAELLNRVCRVSAEDHSLRREAERKCKVVRSMIMEADRRIAKLEWEARKAGQK